jgi:protein ImuA
MAQASQPMSIAEVRRYLERADRHGCVETSVLPFGVPEVDDRLPNGGLARGHLHEAIEAGAASQYAGLATLFVAGILARMPGRVLWSECLAASSALRR